MLRSLTAALAASCLLAGCQGTDAQALTHRPVPAPPAVDGAQPVLWVALEDHLGKAPLQLVAAGSALELSDATGTLGRAQRFSFRWRAQPLPEPLTVRRRVLGPFSSFETAEQAALAWRRLGANAVVAHPGEWEVWAAPEKPAPAEYSSQLEEQVISEVLTLQVQRPEGWRTLQAPVRIQAPGGLRWEGGVFQGPFRLQPDAYGSWTLVEQVPLERYLQGVVPHEIGAGAPAAALAAQAVLARTWALGNQHRFALDGYHLCSDTQCQVYSDPRLARSGVKAAIRATQGQVLAWQGKPIHAVYHASNGGVSANEDEAWSLPDLPYLEPAFDRAGGAPQGLALPLSQRQQVRSVLAATAGVYGQNHPYFRWQRVLGQETFARALGSGAAAVGSPVQPVVLERGPSGRVVRLALRGPLGERVLVRDAIRRTLRRLPSTLFVIEPAGSGLWRFEGGGFGHGAGLSQAGAIDLGGRGWTVQQILRHYYPGTELVPLPSLGTTKGGS